MDRGRDEVMWVEVWIDDPSAGGYVLVLRALSDGSLQLIDPQESGRVVEVFSNYEDAVHWLREDEYGQVEGRYLIE